MVMGRLAASMLAQAFDSFTSADRGLGTGHVADPLIGALEGELHELATLLIARRQPMANDLRQIMAASRIALDMSHIGGLANGIARIGAITGHTYPRTVVTHLDLMAQLTLRQLRNVCDAYEQRNAAKALDVGQQDAFVDAMFQSFFHTLLTHMRQDPGSIDAGGELLSVGRSIERIGDHIANITRSVYFLVHGSLPVAPPTKPGAVQSTAIRSI
jgi:phosphate transport system protein